MSQVVSKPQGGTSKKESLCPLEEICTRAQKAEELAEKKSADALPPERRIGAFEAGPKCPKKDGGNVGRWTGDEGGGADRRAPPSIGNLRIGGEKGGDPGSGLRRRRTRADRDYRRMEKNREESKEKRYKGKSLQP